MKKILFAGALLLGVCFVQVAQASEQIDNFSVRIEIKTDGTITVRESIAYDFGAEAKHGIYRDIPYSYQTANGRFSLRLGGITVTDQTGRAEPFNTSRSGGVLHLKIGDPDRTLSGKKTYVISYEAGRAINYFDDHDELYWNATGGDWQVPINQADALVILPESLPLKDLKSACYGGAPGSQTSCSNILFPDWAADRAGQIEFKQTGLVPESGLTVVVGWPKGLVAKPDALAEVLAFLRDNYILFLPLLALVVMFYLWYARGRDPRGKGVIIPQYDAPDRLSPAEVGTVVDEEADNLDISAEIIHLAVAGYLKINQIKGEGLFQSEDYQFMKLKEQDGLPNDFDRYLLTAIFKGRTEVKLSELKKTFYKDLAKIKEMIYSAAVAKGYFAGDPGRIRAWYLSAGGVIATAGFVFFNWQDNWPAMAALIASGAITMIFGWFMPARTAKGVAAREYILGLKEYLRVAEKDRLEFANAPEKNPAVFEKMLPYAICLKVEKEWAAQFAGIYENTNPAWYGSYNHGAFNALILTDSLRNFTTKSSALLGASAAGHGSGFGGGFGGGGFGGGGGGSW